MALFNASLSEDAQYWKQSRLAGSVSKWTQICTNSVYQQWILWFLFRSFLPLLYGRRLRDAGIEPEAGQGNRTLAFPQLYQLWP